jgi:hypothetical protein
VAELNKTLADLTASLVGDGQPSLPVLETKCPECDGSGGEYAYDEEKWWPCHHCRGAGNVPTPDGERVLALMRHNFRWMLKDAQGD